MAFLDSKIDEEIFGSDYETLIYDFYTLIGCSSGGLTARRIYHMKTSLCLLMRCLGHHYGRRLVLNSFQRHGPEYNGR